VAEAEPRRPVGVRLGLVEVRARLGEPLTDNEDAELQSFGALGSIAPLVLKVVRLLEVNESDAALRETLLSLYPLVQELLGIPTSEIGEDVFEEDQPQQAASKQGTPDKMLAQWLFGNVFIPAGVHVRDGLQSAEVLLKARSAARLARVDVLSGIEKLALIAKYGSVNLRRLSIVSVHPWPPSPQFQESPAAHPQSTRAGSLAILSGVIIPSVALPSQCDVMTDR
jgi:hypothetical protein